MKKALLLVLPLVLLALANAASAYTVVLQAHNQRSNSGTLSTLIWKTCPGSPPFSAPCVNTTTIWAGDNGVTGSTAVWDWNPATQVLSNTGRYEATSHLASNPQGSPVINDRVIDLVIDLTNSITSATSYNCVEGTFLASVGANGCLNTSTGFDFVNSSLALYNVGGNFNCVQRTVNGLDLVNGDDSSTGNPRGLQTAGAAGGCDAVDGGFGLYTKLADTTTTPGGTLRISNGIDILLPSTNYMTFVAVPDAIDDGPIQARTGLAESINVLANDNAFADPVIVAVTTPPTKGTATVVGSPGTKAAIRINYTADVGTTGADSFVYTVTDADNVTTDSATVSINILAFGANDDSATTRLNTGASIPIGANDLGFTDPVTVTIVVPPNQGGGAVAAAPGAAAGQTVAYTPVAALGTPTYTETFTYQMTDGTLTDSGVVTVTVNNAVPDAKVGAITISTAGVAPLNATGGFTAPGAGGSLGDAGTVVINPQGAKGTAVVGVGSLITYTVSDAAFFTGTDTFTYVITDSDGETDSGVVTVTIPAVTPTLANGTITTASGTASAPLALVFTPGNGTLAQHTLAVTGQATKGTCALAGTSVTYTPNAGSTGGDSCVVTITDENGAGQSDTGTISLTITGGGGGGGGSGVSLPSAGAVDLWSLALLAGLPLIRRRRRAAL